MRPTLKCLAWIAACTLTLLWSGPAAAGTGTLVLPLRTLGVTDTTAAVAGELLAGELETRGMTVVRLGPPGEIPSTSSACDEPNCAMTLARAHQADLVVFGSLSRLRRIKSSMVTPNLSAIESSVSPDPTRYSWAAFCSSDLVGVAEKAAATEVWVIACAIAVF